MPGGRTGLAGLAGALALAGCGNPGAPTSEEDIAAEGAKLTKPLPGRYTSITELVDYQLRGASPQDADRLKQEMSAMTGQSRSYCLTEREAEKGFEDMWRRSQEGECRFERFEVDGDKLSATMNCTTPQGVISRVAMEGASAAESSHMRLTIEQQTRAVPGKTVKMVLEIDNLREGDCS